MLVMRDAEGQLRKIPIPLHYLYVFVAGALIGMLSITGIAGSYSRMLMKVATFNQLRTEKEALRNRYKQLEKVAEEKEIQAASLGSLAGEVSAMYGLRQDHTLLESDEIGQEDFASSLGQLYALRSSALSGVTTVALSFDTRRTLTMADWLRMAASPTLWPVEGRVNSSFGQRLDPFNGEGAFHRGIDISSTYGKAVVAPADGVVTLADYMGGYGRVVVLDHGHGITTLFGHLSNMPVMAGQTVRRGETIGFVGLSGRATASHLHYEVRINGVPVNPYKYLRMTMADSGGRSDSAD
jgi:murein DD-endopeptidase MepM/ murein hydrolase activator NlpD